MRRGPRHLSRPRHTRGMGGHDWGSDAPKPHSAGALRGPEGSETLVRIRHGQGPADRSEGGAELRKFDPVGDIEFTVTFAANTCSHGDSDRKSTRLNSSHLG